MSKSLTVGFLGLGKLGLPVALAVESKGHRVIGSEISGHATSVLMSRKYPHCEKGVNELLAKTNLCLVTTKQLVEESDIIFVAVQTPHDPRYEGTTPAPIERKDFDYSFLKSAVHGICDTATKPVNLVIISTVLPGTVRREILPLLQDSPVRLFYNPFFIAMGTVIEDFLKPEFVISGAEKWDDHDPLTQFYKTIHDSPVVRTTIENAEIVKVLYNTFIGLKIAFANTVMELCHKLPNTNCDSVIGALSLATDRLISPRYMRGGMGDGGGCHPRDNIALSWLSEHLNISHNLFDDVMRCREDQTKWLAELILDEHHRTHLPVILLGTAYKPGTNITTGSPALLLSHYLGQVGCPHKLVNDLVANPEIDLQPAIYFVSTDHRWWREFPYPHGSVVIDPWRNQRISPGVRYIPIGIGV